MTSLRRVVCVAATVVPLAACADPAPPEPPAEFVTVRRAWLPGERDALITSIVTGHKYVFPMVGDISSLAPQLYADTDSVTVLVPNPALQASITAPPWGGASLSMFSASWNFVALKITTINNKQAPPDTLFWHMALWSDPADAGNHGWAIAFSRTATFNINPVNTTNFDASFGKAGAAGGEFHTATATYWEDDASGGRYQVTSESFPGAFSTIATGPYLGGQTRTGTVLGRVANSNMVRVSGAETPTSFKVSFDYRVTSLPGVEILCVYPSPCTSNIPLMAGLRGGR